MGASVWTEAMIARLKVLHSEDRPFSNIAEILSRDFHTKVSRNAAIGKAGRVGLVAKQKTSNVVVTRKRRKRRPNGFAQKPQARQLSGLDLADQMLARDPVADLPTDESEFAVTFEQLRAPHCRWPLGDPDTAAFQYCGADKMQHGPYCARHHRLAYHKPVRVSEEERRRRTHQARQNLGIQKLTA